MAAIRTLVNVFGLLLGSQVVFVANGMATEQALQTLGLSLAARSLLRLDDSCKLPEQELVFVVNKNTLRYEGSALEKILEQKFDDPGRQELRDTVRSCFPDRSFFTVPLLGMPAFDESVRALRSHLVTRRKPLEMGGVFVGGRHLAGVMELVVAEVKKSQQVNVPSMNRYVIYEGFLMPLVQDLTDFAQSQLPELSDYDPALEDRSCKDPL
ncbi:rha-1 [Symbiodinium pilosum]|uniref:Rha-1 protein n=1 Tax=Symbiodinium pilosum TaxID=2952 RepID=A0A812S1P7_SYMPI|nr:rha-1 [Symbiodinium pilosum]